MQTKLLEGRTSGRMVDDRQAGAYQSRMLQRYMAHIAKCRSPHILDLGPVSGNNISFFLSLGARLSVCDFMLRLSRQAPGAGPDKALKILDYSDRRFDGIHVWDIPDHLETWLLSDIVKRWFAMLRPGGLIMMLAGPSSVPQPHLHIETIVCDSMVGLEEVPALELPYFHRSNRDIEIVMRPLEQHTSFLCTNGEREFLFRRP
jgi:hypothetical protein